jgi:hypothetical protein
MEHRIFRVFGEFTSVNMGIIANEVIKQGIDSSRFDVRVDTNDYSQIIYSISMMKRTTIIWQEWLKRMANSFIMTAKFCISENFRHRITDQINLRKQRQ